MKIYVAGAGFGTIIKGVVTEDRESPLPGEAVGVMLADGTVIPVACDRAESFKQGEIIDLWQPVPIPTWRIGK